MITTPLMDTLAGDLKELIELHIIAEQRDKVNKSEQQRIRNLLNKIKNQITIVKKESLELSN
jgi:hypothetical protein